MHVELGGYHVGDIEFSAAIDVGAQKVGRRPGRGGLRRAEQHVPVLDVPKLGVTVRRGPTMDGIGKYLKDVVIESAAKPVDVARGAAGERDGRGRVLPAGRQRAGGRVLRRAVPGGGVRAGELHPGVPGQQGQVAAAVRGQAAAAGRRRHQEPGRGDDHPPHAGQPVQAAGRAGGPHVPAELRRQHRLPEHARAGAAGEQEDQQAERRHQPARAAAQRRQRPHRAQRPRAVADRPQVRLHPHRGDHVRQRADQRRAEAGGVGQPQQRRRGDRRRPVREAGAGPRHRRGADRAEQLLHEEPARAVHRRRGPPPDRGVHRRRAGPGRGPGPDRAGGGERPPAGERGEGERREASRRPQDQGGGGRA